MQKRENGKDTLYAVQTGEQIAVLLENKGGVDGRDKGCLIRIRKVKGYAKQAQDLNTNSSD